MDCGGTQTSKSSQPEKMSVCESEADKLESTDSCNREKLETADSFTCDSVPEKRDAKTKFGIFETKENFESPLRAYHREMEEELMQICSPKPDSQETRDSCDPPILSDVEDSVDTQDVPLSQISILEAEFETPFVLTTDSVEMPEIDRSLLDASFVFLKNSQEKELEDEQTSGKTEGNIW